MECHVRLLIAAIALSAACLLNCAPRTTITGAPELEKGQSLAPGFTPLPSVVNVPIEMRTRVVEEMLNKQFSGLLYECDTLTLGPAKPVKIKIWKGDTIRLSLNGDELRYRLPLRIWLQFSFTVGALGFSHVETQDVEGEIALTFKSRIFVKNDWQVATMTQAEGHDWISNPVVKIHFLTIPVKPLADLIVSTQLAGFGQTIDKEINQILNVKGILFPLWNKIQEPMLLTRNPAVWLRLTPKAVYMTQLQGSEGIIRSAAGIQTVAETFVGDTPKVARKDSLPDFIIPGRVDSSFVLNLYSEMSYESAADILRGYLLGRSFSYGRKQVIIQGIDMLGVAGYAAIGIDFFGSYKGRVYVIGRPQFDSVTSVVSIEDLEFDLKTKNAAQSAAQWLLHGIILGKIKPYLRFPLKEKILESQLAIQKMMCHSEVMDNVFITGSIDSLRVGGVRLTDRAIQAVVFARGSLFLTVHD
jgi:hypothetical protein